MSHAHNDREQLLSRTFVELADTLVDDYDVINVLDRLVAHAVTLLAVNAAGIMLAGPRGRLQVVASSSEESGWMELLQVQADDGPCAECVRTGKPVTVTDLDAGRWPQSVAALAGRASYRSVHALPLRLRGRVIGVMGLFHSEPGPLPETDICLGQALADIATIGILQERAVHDAEIVIEQLQAALNSRVVIEQAKGVLARAGSLTMDAAFDRLRRHARGHNLLLGDIARRVATDHNFAHQLLDGI